MRLLKIKVRIKKANFLGTTQITNLRTKKMMKRSIRMMMEAAKNKAIKPTES